MTAAWRSRTNRALCVVDFTYMNIIRKVKNMLMPFRDGLVADVRSRYVMHRLMHPAMLTYILES